MQNSCQLFALYNFFSFRHIHTYKMFTILIHQHGILTSAKHSHAILRLTRLYNMDAVAKDMPFTKMYNYMTSLFVQFFLFFKGAPQYEGLLRMVPINLYMYVYAYICMCECSIRVQFNACISECDWTTDQPTNICTNIYIVIKHTRPFPFLFFLFLYHSQSISVVSVCIQPR